MHLLLFDIDGTLIRSNGAGRAALVKALEDLFGTAGPIESYEMAGKTDPLIIGDLLTAIGLDQSDIEASLPDVYRLMTDYGRRMYVSRGIVSCAGVPELLQALDSQPEALVGLLTGNIISTAPLKLAAAGLSPAYFR
jgi:phosphoglycolate phosphatase